MEPESFDVLTRSFARRGSRRGLLGGLAAGAASTALAHLGVASTMARSGPWQRTPRTATVCHKGRDRRVPLSVLAAHLNHGDTAGPCGGARPGHGPWHGGDDSNGVLRGNSLLLINPQEARSTVHVECGDPRAGSSCDVLATFDIPRGESRLFDTSVTEAFCWVQNKYWLDFANPFIGLPLISVAVGGSGPDSYPCHKTPGTITIMFGESMSKTQLRGAVDLTSDPHRVFYFWRQEDKPDFKFYYVLLPANL
jgi:hypothetical protein